MQNKQELINTQRLFRVHQTSNMQKIKIERVQGFMTKGKCKKNALSGNCKKVFFKSSLGFFCPAALLHL